jgi:hypothetical protein
LIDHVDTFLAIHMGFDCLAIGVGLFASIMATWPPNERFTYGSVVLPSFLEALPKIVSQVRPNRDPLWLCERHFSDSDINFHRIRSHTTPVSNVCCLKITAADITQCEPTRNEHQPTSFGQHCGIRYQSVWHAGNGRSCAPWTFAWPRTWA